MFQIGDKVVHPMHGAGIIDSIVDERIGGKTQAYYVFRMPVNGLVLKIPTANSSAVGLRAVVDPDYADQVIASLSGLQIDVISNWNRRYRENLERIKSGDLYEVARVIKCLMLREAQRGLSTGERKMLHSAKQIFISEIVLAKNLPYGDIERRLNDTCTREELFRDNGRLLAGCQAHACPYLLMEQHYPTSVLELEELLCSPPQCP